MSTMKKIGALIMALAMCFALAMPAFAADTTGSITVTNATKTVKVEENGATVEKDNTYTAYRIFAASVTDNQGNDNTKPTATTNGTVVYTATKAQADWWKANNPDLFDFQDAGDGSYIVSTKATADRIAKYFNENKATLIGVSGLLTNEGDLTFNADGKTASATGLELGYYFISSAYGSVVSIDTTNNDVQVVDKNKYEGDGFTPTNPDGELKDVYMVGSNVIDYTDADGDGVAETTPVSVNIGDIVTYQVRTTTSNYVEKTADGESTPHSEKVEALSITDKLDDGLDYEGDVTVSVGSTKLAESAYRVVKDDGVRAFTVVVPWVDSEGELLYTEGSELVVEYQAKVNENIKMSKGTGASENGGNEADVFVKSNPDDGHKPDPTPDPVPDPGDPATGSDQVVDGNEVSVYTYALAILKVDGNDQTALKGAKFTIAPKGGEALKVKATSTEGVYTYDPTATATELETPVSGIIIVKGLADGAYIATETEAPANYNKMQGGAEFQTIVAGTTTTKTSVSTVKYYEEATDGQYVKSNEGKFVEATASDSEKTHYKLVNVKSSDSTVEVTEDVPNVTLSEFAQSMSIANYTGTELPSTGGIGTTIFYVVGGAMVIGAGVLLIVKKRMAE